jgi:hypothetical protein
MKPTPKHLCDDGIFRYPDGREVCQITSKLGMDEYMRRKRVMWERQGRMCCLYGHLADCPGRLNWADTTFDHEVPRGHGGGARDDRIEVDGKWMNGAAHWRCNDAKGSRRIHYNDAHNKLIDVPTRQRAARIEE